MNAEPAPAPSLPRTGEQLAAYVRGVAEARDQWHKQSPFVRGPRPPAVDEVLGEVLADVLLRFRALEIRLGLIEMHLPVPENDVPLVAYVPAAQVGDYEKNGWVHP